MNASTDGIVYYSHGWKNNTDYCAAGDVGSVNISYGANVCSTESEMSDVGLNEWKTTFSYGTIYGEASCQATLDADMAYLSNNMDNVAKGKMDPYEFIANYTAIAGQEKASILTDIFTRYSNGQMSSDELGGETYAKLLSSDDSKYNKNTTGQYCFCKATEYKPLNGSKQNVVSSGWVFNTGMVDADRCASSCASQCGDTVGFSEIVRIGLFGSGN